MFKQMRHMLCALALISSGSAAVAQDGAGPVVVELYTSQGCSSCPPADEVLHDLAKRDGVIALALHVDYWDYIGWKDVFADPAHGDRQRGFARRAGKRMVYTPQMVLDGATQVVGNKPMAVADAVAERRGLANPVTVRIAREDGRLTIMAQGNVSNRMEVHLVRFTPQETVEITRGENRGRVLSYANVVREWQVIGRWNGRRPLEMQTRVSGSEPVVVLIQGEDHGEIYGAALLR